MTHLNPDTQKLRWDDMRISRRRYNAWYMESALKIFDEAQNDLTEHVDLVFTMTNNLRELSPNLILENPAIVKVLRSCASPPLSRARLSGLAECSLSLIPTLESGKLPSSNAASDPYSDAMRICRIFDKTIDPRLLSLRSDSARQIIVDRMCWTNATTKLRTAQEARLVHRITHWLHRIGYRESTETTQLISLMAPGSFTVNHQVVVTLTSGKSLTIPLSVVVQPAIRRDSRIPVLISVRSAGDTTNLNKRRKEDVLRSRQLVAEYGPDASTILFLSGYISIDYLDYVENGGLQWVWEHRIDDFLYAKL